MYNISNSKILLVAIPPHSLLWPYMALVLCNGGISIQEQFFHCLFFQLQPPIRAFTQCHFNKIQQVSVILRY